MNGTSSMKVETARANLMDRQRDGLIQMLNFNKLPEESSGGIDEKWKVLVYDDFCRDVISPLLKVGDLQSRGVTLHLEISSTRDAVPGVTAIYFVKPSADTVDRIASDVSRSLYDAFHLNFAQPVPRPLMESLAGKTLETDSVRLVSKIFDHSCNFVTLEPFLYTLNQSDAYFEMHRPGLKDTAMMAQLEEVAEGIFSAVSTLGRVPIIRAQPGNAAAMIAGMLNKKLQEELKGRGANYFSSDLGHQRPVLVLLDRQVDIPVMLLHGWTYQALVHETVATRLNHVTCKTASGTSENDLDPVDPFWMENKSKDFPHAADAMDVSTKQYQADEEAFKSKTSMSGASGEGVQLVGDAATRGLTDAIHLIPEMQEKKRRIDIHTNLLTGILQEIKGRSLNKLHQLELTMMRGGKLDQKELEALLQSESTRDGDKLRLAMIRFLTCGGDKEEVANCEEIAEKCESASAFAYLKQLDMLNTMGAPPMANADSAEANLSSAANWMKDALSSATTLASNMMGSQWKTNTTRIVEGVMEQYGTPEVEQMLYLDPCAQSSSHPKVTTPYNDAMVFVVGGGNYTEYQNLQAVIATEESGKTVTYGSTELCSPSAFVDQLARLK
eukprot:TRINITY_DN20816_c0_g1_i1.p1 TRINITY_DN20816_c0_g1~~TRINITY_DN20816_c0_g1_i1.p1  ORF type:complete len:612 (-),score=140.15 TRINITY_DN20816_c0_g1_i1:137-1972(-)